MKSTTYSKVNALSIKTRSPADLRSEVKKNDYFLIVYLVLATSSN